MSDPADVGKVPVGTYWEPGTWEAARSAYIADLDTDPTTPGSFVGWLHHTLQRHIDRTPSGRAGLEIPAPQRKQANGPAKLNRTFPLNVELVAGLEAAIVEDRASGRVLSRSGFIHEAVTAAADEARQRLGSDLPTPPARLPNRPPRRPG